MDSKTESTKIGEEAAKYDAPTQFTWFGWPRKCVAIIVSLSIIVGWFLARLF